LDDRDAEGERLARAGLGFAEDVGMTSAWISKGVSIPRARSRWLTSSDAPSSLNE
jgi:hypothetical protein